MSVRSRNAGWLFLIGSIATIAVGCGKPLSQEECNRLLDHYTDKQIDQARPSTGPGERARLLMEAREKAAIDPAFATCSEEVSRSQFECAMAAGTADAIERCLL